MTQDAQTGVYHLTFKLFSAGMKYVSGTGLGQGVAYRLDDAAHRYAKIVKYGAYERGEIVYLYRGATDSALRRDLGVGTLIPAHSSALGKAILAFGPPHLAEGFLKHRRLTPFTPRTITDPVEFRRELARIREAGFALDNGENIEEMRCVAAPVFNHASAVTAAVSFSGPWSQMGDDVLPDLIQAVRSLADEISAMLGYTASGRV